MADMFGDYSLFSEFDRDRKSTSSFISHQGEEEDKSKITFTIDSDSEPSASCEESDEEEVIVVTGTDDGDDSTTTKSADMESSGENMSEVNDKLNFAVDGDCVSGEEKVWMGEATDDMSSNKATRNANGVKVYTNLTDHQSDFEWKKLKRFTKKIDSTRYVPDEESPAVQVLFQNNNFSRKHRAQIEQFISQLIFQDLNEKHEKLPELHIKANTLTCVDLNSELSPDLRTGRMWKAHAIIGSTHFYDYFVIDTSGWPLVELNPSLTDSWEVPFYEQVFPTALPMDEEEAALEEKRRMRFDRRSFCFNCEGDHKVNECMERKDYKKIKHNHQIFLEHYTGGSKLRYHEDPRFSKFKPGKISNALHDALGLKKKQLPMYIYQMRRHGYPPGWLEDARRKSSGLTMFDKDGKKVDASGNTLEEGELEQDPQDASIDVDKIIEYPGFTVPLPEGYQDDSKKIGMPPVQEHQLKRMLYSVQSNKRKVIDEGIYSVEKKLKGNHKTEEEMDLDDEDGFPDYYALSSKNIESSSSFIPPLPADTPPSSKPPLPSCTPPKSPSSNFRSPKYPPTPVTTTYQPPLPPDSPPTDPPIPDYTPPSTPPLFKRKKLSLPKPRSSHSSLDALGNLDSSRDSTPSLEELEAEYKSIQKQLQEEPDSGDESEVQIIELEKSNKNSSLNCPDLVPFVRQDTIPLTLASSSSSSSSPTSGSPGILCKSISKDYGTPVLMKKGRGYPSLPDRQNFSKGIGDHMLFENLPTSTGTFNKMRSLLQRVKQKMDQSSKKSS